MLNKKGYTRYNKKSVCCSGYYIKVAQISCPPLLRPRLQWWKVYRRPAVSCHPYAVHPGAFVDSISRHRPSVFVFAL